MKYATIKETDIANGTGVRVSLFVSGCTHHCKGCFNEIAWDFDYGKEFTQDTIDYIIDHLKPNYIKGLTLLGGEPMDPKNQKDILILLRQVNTKLPDKDIWCYTGYLYEDLLDKGRANTPYTDEILEYINILVDGPFIQEQKDITLKFRGSTNQRIIYLKTKNKE